MRSLFIRAGLGGLLRGEDSTPQPSPGEDGDDMEQMQLAIQKAWLQEGGVKMKTIRLKGSLDAGFISGNEGDEFTVTNNQAKNLLKEKPDLVEEVKADPKPQPPAMEAQGDDVPGAPPKMKTKARASKRATTKGKG